MARRIPRVSSGGVSVSRMLKRRNRRDKEGCETDGIILPMDDPEVLISRLSGVFKMNGFRYGEYTHVSDIIGKCMRMVALSYVTKVDLHGEALYDNTGVTFAIGNAIHDYVKAKAIRNNPEEIYGRWQCYCGGTEVVGTYNKAMSTKKGPATCSKCGELPTKYEELLLTNDEYMISGAVDLAHLINGLLYLSEIKSIKHEAWEALTAPLPAHILQIIFYWWLAKEMGYAIHQQVSVFYVTKSYVFGKSPFKEFVLDPQEYLCRIEDYKEEAMELKIAREGGKLPYKACRTKGDKRAVSCEMCSVCFAWKD